MILLLSFLETRQGEAFCRAGEWSAREPVPRSTFLSEGFAEGHIYRTGGASPFALVPPLRLESGEQGVKCPYLRTSGPGIRCDAYLGSPGEPSIYEQEYYCATRCHRRCVWFISGEKEVINRKGPQEFHLHSGGYGSPEALAGNIDQKRRRR
jgi:hypothetical protein